MRYRALIFDLDGTLVDSAAAILRGLRLALAAVGLPDPGDARLRSMIGVPLDATFHEGLGVPRERVAAAREVYRDFWIAEGRGLTALMHGARDLLDELHGAGIACAVATAKTTDGAWNTVRRHALDTVFGGRVFGYEVGDRPGKVDVVGRALAACDAAAIDRRTTVFIGDALGDALAAREHHLDFIHCRYGYGDPAVIADLPVAHGVEALTDLRRHLLPED